MVETKDGTFLSPEEWRALDDAARNCPYCYGAKWIHCLEATFYVASPEDPEGLSGQDFRRFLLPVDFTAEDVKAAIERSKPVGRWQITIAPTCVICDCQALPGRRTFKDRFGFPPVENATSHYREAWQRLRTMLCQALPDKELKTDKPKQAKPTPDVKTIGQVLAKSIIKRKP